MQYFLAHQWAQMVEILHVPTWRSLWHSLKMLWLLWWGKKKSRLTWGAAAQGRSCWGWKHNEVIRIPHTRSWEKYVFIKVDQYIPPQEIIIHAGAQFHQRVLKPKWKSREFYRRIIRTGWNMQVWGEEKWERQRQNGGGFFFQKDLTLDTTMQLDLPNERCCVARSPAGEAVALHRGAPPRWGQPEKRPYVLIIQNDPPERRCVAEKSTMGEEE